MIDEQPTDAWDGTASAERLATLLGVSPRRVRELAREGIAVKRGRGTYEIASTVARYCEHLRGVAGGRASRDGSIDLVRERALLARAQRIGYEIKNAATRGELVPIAEVARGWADILRRVRSAILAIPSRYRQQLPHLSARDIDVLDRELRATLLELSGCAEEREPDEAA